MEKVDQSINSEFINFYCQMVDQCHGQRPDDLWFATWMASKSPYFDFPKSFERFWQTGKIKADFPLGKRLFSFFYLSKTLLSLIVKMLYCRFVFREELKNIFQEPKSFNVVRTFLYAADNSKPDPFWNILPEALSQEQHPLLIIYEPTFSFIDCKKAYRAYLNNIPYFAFLDFFTLLKNYFKIGKETIFPGQVNLKGNFSVKNSDLTDAIISSYKKDLLHPSSFVHLGFFNCFLNLFKRIKINHLYLTFENNPWEKMAYLARTKAGKKFNIFGFQHASIPKDAANYFLSAYENEQHLYPDTIMTVGAYTAELLKNYPYYKNAHIKIGCALRHQYLEKLTYEPNHFEDRLKILVVLDGTRDTINLLNLTASFLDSMPDFNGQIILKEHPNMPISLFAPAFLQSKYIVNKKIKVSTSLLPVELNWANLVIYSGSTVCIEALKMGRAVINCNFSLFNYDPLFQFHDFKWEATNAKELANAIKKIEALTMTQIAEKQEKGYALVNQYFFPCITENIEGFLIT